MKILILQLARLGDIYMNWPALRAIRRMYPEAQIDLLTRTRFEGAVEGLKVIDRHLTLPSERLLEPLINENPNVDLSLEKLESFLSGLRDNNYDWIINFSFSPVSSYLTHAVSVPSTKVTGYTRFNDGYFNPNDEISSYFYAQVGPGRKNRVHISDIFASMLNIEYIESDWAAPDCHTKIHLPDNYLVIHVGASEKHKSMGAAEWIHALNFIRKGHPGKTFVLIGAESEVQISDEICSACEGAQIFNLVGKTKIFDLFSIIKKAELLVGCDSAPIHMASLVDTPTLNISVGNVNFWETGPKSSLSFILRFNDQVADGAKVGQVVCDILKGKVSKGLILRSAGLVSYVIENETESESFDWKLIEAIYLGAPYPMAERIEVIHGAMKLSDVNHFIMEQIALIPEIGIERIVPLVEQGEQIIKTISQIVPELSPLIHWYQAEKIRIAPGNPEEVRLATLEVHKRFNMHLRAYILEDDAKKIEDVNGAF